MKTKTLLTESQKRSLELTKREANDIIRSVNWLTTEDLNRPSLLSGLEDIRKQSQLIAYSALGLAKELEVKK